MDEDQDLDLDDDEDDSEERLDYLTAAHALHSCQHGQHDANGLWTVEAAHGASYEHLYQPALLDEQEEDEADEEDEGDGEEEGQVLEEEDIEEEVLSGLSTSMPSGLGELGIGMNMACIGSIISSSSADATAMLTQETEEEYGWLLDEHLQQQQSCHLHQQQQQSCHLHQQHSLAGALVLKGLDAKLLCGPVRNPIPNYSAEFVAAHNPVRRARLTFIASLFACSKCTLLSHSS